MPNDVFVVWLWGFFVLQRRSLLYHLLLGGDWFITTLCSPIWYGLQIGLFTAFFFICNCFSEAPEGHILNGLPASVLFSERATEERGEKMHWLSMLLVRQGNNKGENCWVFLNGTNWIALAFYRATNCFSYSSARFVCFLMSFVPSLESKRSIQRRQRLQFWKHNTKKRRDK